MIGDPQPAWLLHRRPYGDNGFLAEVLTLEQGRLSMVVRGARRRSRGGSVGAMLQPFVPLLLAVRGGADLRLCQSVETAGPRLGLSGLPLISGLYLNEILVRLLPRFDPQPAVFASYGETLDKLLTEHGEAGLRRFELELLKALGYAINFRTDAHGEAIAIDGSYRYLVDGGFERCLDPGAARPLDYHGEQLVACADWWERLPGVTVAPPGVLKSITRQALAGLLGGRPLNARQLARQHSSLKVSTGDVRS